MSSRSFRSVFMVASCAGAALGCYLVSLRVASERAALEDVETKIVLAQRDLRLLQTEIGTRGRLAQLERWNVRVLALSAPSADQFLNGGFELARLAAPQHRIDLEAPVVLASASTDTERPKIEGVEPTDQAAKDLSPKQIMHVASLKREPAGSDVRAMVSLKPSKPPVEQSAAKPRETEPAPARLAAAKPKPASPPARKAPESASKSTALGADPLAPLAAPAKPRTVATTTSKDMARKQ